MLLERLLEYGDRLDLPPSMYIRTPIRWFVDLDSSGRLLGFVPTPGEGRSADRGAFRLAPHIQRSSGVRAKLLADNAEYVLGTARDPAKQERVDRCHEAFAELVAACAAATGEPAVVAVDRFLGGLDRDALSLPDGFDPSHTLTFRVGEVLPIDLPAVRKWWAGSTTEGEEEESPAEKMECLVCGEVKPVEARMPFKIKGIPGGQASGTVLVSANAPAFESYGLEASLIAPTCRDCAETYTKVLNVLLREPETHLAVGPTVYVFWTREDPGFSVATLLSRPEPGAVRELLTAAWSGRREAAELAPEPFYAAAFAASGGRVALRDWLETTLPEVRHHVARFFHLQDIADPASPDERHYYGLYALAAGTVRDASKDLPATTPRALLSLALRGGALPPGLLYQAVRRNRAEQGITRPRAALLKMVLLSRQPDLSQEDAMVDLDPENTHPAYRCGRLLAVLEAIQRQALGRGIKSTVTDRFFGTASAAPASVFGRLLRGARPHLAKLRKERPGTSRALEERLEEVVAPLAGFPKILNLEEQALFSLGYYHQKAHDHAEARKHAAAKRNADTAAEAGEDA